MTRRRILMSAGAGSIAVASSSVLSGCSTAATTTNASPVSFDPQIHVDRELRSMVPMLEQIAQWPLSMATLDAGRKGQFALPVLPQPLWSERMIAGPTGPASLRVYVVNATDQGSVPRAAILYMHGGGFVMGSAMATVRVVQELASALDCVAITVDYRLAPETPFPGSLEDTYAALKWLYANADELGVDRSRIAVMGESAGGGHAAMLAIAARDRGEVPLVFQALMYPMLDDRTGSTRQVPPHVGTLVWTAEKNRFGWTSLLGVEAGSRRVPYGSVPARVKNVQGLPPAFICVGSIDLFAREDIEYAQRLLEAGVGTELNVVSGAYHGFELAAPKATVSKQVTAALHSALSRAFERKSV